MENGSHRMMPLLCLLIKLVSFSLVLEKSIDDKRRIRQTNGSMDGWVDGRMGGWMDG